MEKKETVTAHPLGMCERLYHAFTNSHSLLPFRRPHQTSGSSVPVTEEGPKNSGHAQPQACGTAPTAKVGLNTNQEKAIVTNAAKATGGGVTTPEKEKQAAKVVERVPQQRTAPPVATEKAAPPVMPTIAAEKGKAESPALPPTATEKGKTAPPAVTTVALEKGKAASMVLPTVATEKDKAAATMATAPTMEKGKAEPPVRSITNINDTSENYIRRARNSMRTISSVGGAQK